MCDVHGCGALQAPTRRRLLGAGAALASLWLGAPLAAKEALPERGLSPQQALAVLQQGNSRYVSGRSTARDLVAARAQHPLGQRPLAAVLCCADSRVVPELVFDQGPGDLFVVRVAGNVVTPEGLASLEYGVRFLGVPLVMVLGHSSCGAVSAAVSVVQQQAQLPGHLPALVEAIRPAVELAAQRDPAHVHAAATEGNVRHQVARLATADPLLAPQVKSGALQVVGALYTLETGRVTLV